MKVNVNTPEFCPDNCRFAQIEVEKLYSGDLPNATLYKCSNEGLCRALYKHLKENHE